MKQIQLGKVKTSVLGLGCMRLPGHSVEEAEALIETALEQEINLFDHADIYGGGEAERIFGQVLHRSPSLRDRMVLQSKCGICKGFYDFSYEHLMESVEGILARLQTSYLDILLFHRPDVLAEPEAFAAAVRDLKAQGKVRQFGVSNMNPAQMELLESWSGETFVADQLQLSLVHAGLVTSGVNVNLQNPEGTMYDGSVLPFCQRTGKAIQAWSPLQDRNMRACFVGNEAFPALNRELARLAEAYQVSPAAIALAWILRIPGKLQAIVGTSDPTHLRQVCQAAEVTLSRPEWYELYRSCGYMLP